MRTREIDVAGIKIGGSHPLFLIAGPCVIESLESCMEAARQIKKVAASAKIPFIFKSSFDKANRTSISSYRGPGLKEGLEVLAAIKRELKVPILTDVHEVAHCEAAAEVADVLQIPAFLCRQTDLLSAAGKTGRVVNVKRGQFMAPGDMRNVVDKIKSTDNEDIILTERGTCFGYHYLINDMRALPAMRMMGFPIVFDATHSVQTPGGMGSRSGGERQYVAPLARAAVATGIDGIFMEAHPDPEKALSDGPSMLRISDLLPLLQLLQRIDCEVRQAIQAEEFEAKTEVPRSGAGNTFISMSQKNK